ncbi:MAG: ACT domain-containing protein [Anaerohalosphaeraceae bacterium]
MHLDTQFSIFMVNKPGVLARVLNTLAVAKINIVAMTMMDSAEHGVMRLVGSSHPGVREVLTQLNMQFNETDVLCVNLPNKAGALADITAKLAAAHINIAYAYVTAGARGGRTTGILKVADVKKAMKVLQGDAEMQHKEDSVRRSPSSHR